MQMLRTRIAKLESATQPAEKPMTDAERKALHHQLNEALLAAPDPSIVAERERRAHLPPSELLALLLSEEPKLPPASDRNSRNVGTRLQASVEAWVTWNGSGKSGNCAFRGT